MTRRPPHLARSRATTLLVAWLLASATALGTTAGGAGSADSADLDAVRRILQRRPGQDVRSETDLARELAALGPGVVPELLALVNGRATRRLLGSDDEAPGSATAWALGPDRFEALARTALGRLPPADVLAHVSAASIESDADRVAALHVLAELGSGRGLQAVMAIASGFEPLALRSPVLRGAFENALIAILRDDPEAWSRLAAPLERLRPDLRAIAARAVIATDQPEGARVLASLLGRADPGTERTIGAGPQDEELLDGIAKLVRRHAWRAPGVADDVRAYLAHERPELRAAAARALARMAGAAAGRESLHALRELLEDPSPEVRRAADDALRTLSGTAVPTDAASWTAWLAAEEAWWLGEGERLVAAVSAAEPASVLVAVRELAAHPALRGETGPALAHALGNGEPSCVAAAASALARIGYSKAVPALGLLLFEADERVAAAAWEALRALTGDDLPLDGLVWDERIRG